MRTAWVVIGLAFAFASGCRNSDWIERTLVTVDVTGVWEGKQTSLGAGGSAGASFSNDIELVLQQEGAKVRGELRGIRGPGASFTGIISIEGTVGGDMFSFHEVSGQQMRVDLQVNGDEMTGAGERLSRFTMSLRRRQ